MAVRWRICALLFFATTVNYVDRNVLSFTALDDTFRKEMLEMPADSKLSDDHVLEFKKRMGYIDGLFKIAYGLGFLFAGYLIDKLGTRKGFSISIFVWSLAGVLNGFIGTLKGLGATRFLLGIGESGNFPSAIKAVAEWFPRRERSFATGVFNAGANIGIILTALAVPVLIHNFGWRTAFVVTGLLGFAVLTFWLLVYRKPEEHPTVTQAELNHISSDNEAEPTQKVSWWKLLGYRQTWVFAVCKMLADPIWYFFLFWLPDFFNSNDALEQKLDLKNISIPFIIIYLVSDGGSVFFGWLSSKLIQRGWSVYKARKFAMLLCALCVAPIFFASITSSIYIAVALIALAAAAHQGWSANVFTLASDMFPKSTLASVVGIGSMMGSLTGALFTIIAGHVLEERLGYFPLFVVASSAYLLALLIVHLISPKMEKVEM